MLQAKKNNHVTRKEIMKNILSIINTKKYLLMICLISMNMFISSNATVSRINEPGYWPIGGSIVADPTVANDTIVTISASNVIFDVKEYMLSQLSTNNMTNLTGVFVVPNVSNITIKNGTINGLTGVGIYVSDGCSQIYLENLLISNCDEGGILLAGSTTGTGISQIVITNCLVNECTPADTSDAYGIRMIATTNAIIQDCIINDNQSLLGTAGYGISLESCSICELSNCKSYNNGGASFGAGINIYHSNGCSLLDCSVANNLVTSLSSTTTACGFYATLSNLLLFSNCLSNHNLNAAGNTMGFYSFDNSNISYQHCFAAANVGGFFAAGLCSSSDTIIGVLDNIFNINTALLSTGSGYGILLNSTQNSSVNNNTISYNSGTQGYGLADTTLNTNNLIINNVSFSNTTTGYSVSFTQGELPVIFATNNNFSSLMNTSPYFNIAIVP